jgi:23S rRNA pseudouridine955/2504/2580 synthase
LQLVAPMPEHMKDTWNTFAWGDDDYPEDPFEGFE